MKLRKLLGLLGMTAMLSVTAACAQDTKDIQQEETNQEVQQEEADTQEESAEDAQEAGTEEEISSAWVRIYGEITGIGEDTLTVDNQSEVSASGEMILNIDPENTLLLDAQTGLPATLAGLEKGRFEAYLGDVMTMSIPPQTTPYAVIVNISEEDTAPVYVEAAEDAVLEDGYYILKTTDGQTFSLPEDVDIQPFRTKNIVRPEDITEGRRCFIWTDEEQNVVKVILMAE